MSTWRLAEIRELRVDETSGDAPYMPGVWDLESARVELLLEVDRLRSKLAATVEAHNQAGGKLTDMQAIVADRDRLARLRRTALDLAAEAYTDHGAHIQEGGTWDGESPTVDAHELIVALEAGAADLGGGVSHGKAQS
jgi:hypothetical protein